MTTFLLPQTCSFALVFMFRGLLLISGRRGCYSSPLRAPLGRITFPRLVSNKYRHHSEILLNYDDSPWLGRVRFCIASNPKDHPTPDISLDFASCKHDRNHKVEVECMSYVSAWFPCLASASSVRVGANTSCISSRAGISSCYQQTITSCSAFFSQSVRYLSMEPSYYDILIELGPTCYGVSWLDE